MQECADGIYSSQKYFRAKPLGSAARETVSATHVWRTLKTFHPRSVFPREKSAMGASHRNWCNTEKLRETKLGDTPPSWRGTHTFTIPPETPLSTQMACSPAHAIYQTAGQSAGCKGSCPRPGRRALRILTKGRKKGGVREKTIRFKEHQTLGKI